MMLPAFSFNASTPITLDSSVLINLIACGHARAILRALPSPATVVEQVVNEIGRGTKRQRDDDESLRSLILDGTVEPITLAETALTIYESLVIGPATATLDDGEAATLAHAVDTGSVAVIDERKATLLSRKRYPEVQVLCTVDLLASELVKDALGSLKLEEAVFGALLRGRMQVPPSYLDWVVRTIGKERAEKCSSLPASVRVLLHPMSN